jgi:hypothetical protein
MRAATIALVLTACGTLGAQTNGEAPTLEQTVAWLSKDAAPILRSETPRSTITLRYIDALTVENCRMTWLDSHVLLGATSSNRLTLPLADLDLGGVHVRTFPDTSSIVEFGPRVARPPVWIAVGQPAERRDTMRVVAFPVRNVSDGQRVVNAIKRAGLLCGASPSPF